MSVGVVVTVTSVTRVCFPDRLAKGLSFEAAAAWNRRQGDGTALAIGDHLAHGLLALDQHRADAVGLASVLPDGEHDIVGRGQEADGIDTAPRQLGSDPVGGSDDLGPVGRPLAIPVRKGRAGGIFRSFYGHALFPFSSRLETALTSSVANQWARLDAEV